MDNWHALATSNQTETLPSDSYLKVYHGQLGEISVGFGEQAGKTNEQYYDSYYQNLKNNDDLSMSMGRSQQ